MMAANFLAPRTVSSSTALRCGLRSRDSSTFRRRTSLRLQKKARGPRLSANISLRSLANEDSTYGGQIVSQIWPTGSVKREKGHFSQNPSNKRIPGTTLLQEKDNFPEQIEVSSEQDWEAVIQKLVPLIKESLEGVQAGENGISVSAYDTAWVARIPAADGSGRPHFPGTLEWIVANQHSDGSWGDAKKDWLYDRFAQTLACIVALASSNHCALSLQKGIAYIRRHAGKLQDEEIIRMPIGFELSFPALLAEAKNLGLNLPYDTPFFRTLEELREKKLQKIPLKLVHAQPTTLLHTLEGIQSLDIDWAQVLKFQSEDGSMCCSPSSTAVLYIHTGDKKCLSFLETAVQKFNNAVPTCYPLDTFYNLWVVDTLERLGIARYFETEIDGILSSVYRHWSDERGICWSRVLREVPDLDDTSMAFRLLRQHGYSVSAEAFQGFQKDKAFSCFAVGQMVQGVSDMFNLLRASKTAYPGEQRLEEAQKFSKEFLANALKKNKGDADKWSLKKDLSGEVEYALKYPEHNSLKRMEVRDYLDKYGPDDAWIGKSIYRLALVNNHNYLELAKADFNRCQKLHQQDLKIILRWISNSGVADSSTVREKIVNLYAMFSAEVWEPEFSAVRIAAGKSMFIGMALYQLFADTQSSVADLRLLVEAIKRWDPSAVDNLPTKFKCCFRLLNDSLNGLAAKSSDDLNLSGQLTHIWEKLVSSFLLETEWRTASSTTRAAADYWKITSSSSGLDTIALSSILMSGEAKSPHFVTWIQEKESSLLRTASEAVRLAQGLAANNKDDQWYFETIYTTYLRDNKTATIEEAENHFDSMKEQIFRELNWQQGHLSTLPDIVKRVAIALTKVANCYYDSNYEEESQIQLKQLLVNPVG